MEAGFPISIVSKTEQNFGNLWISNFVPRPSLKNFQKSKPWLVRSCLQPLHKSMKDGVHLLLPRTTNVTTLNPGGTTHFTAKKTAVLKPNPPEHQSQNPPNLDHLVTTMGWGISSGTSCSYPIWEAKDANVWSWRYFEKMIQIISDIYPFPFVPLPSKNKQLKNQIILLMEEILHHLGCIKAYK